MSGGLDWSKAAVRTTHPQGMGELPGPFASLSQRGRGVSQQTPAPDLWAAVRDNPPLGQVRSGGSPPPMEVEPWGCGGGCGSRVSTAQPRSSGPPQHVADAVPWPFAALAERGQKTAAKAEPYDLWAPLRQGGQASSEGCGCQEKAPARRAQQQQSGGPTVKIVSGDWLAEVMRFDAETARQIAGQDVHLDAEAWGAVRSAQRARLAASLERTESSRRRAEIWPRAATSGEWVSKREQPSGSGQRSRTDALADSANDTAGCASSKADFTCDCDTSDLFPYVVEARYVDQKMGSDDYSGGLEVHVESHLLQLRLRPWRSLRVVETWLNDLAEDANGKNQCIVGAAVYLRTGCTWDGTEEKDEEGDLLSGPVDYLDWAGDLARTGQPILEIRNFRASDYAPLILSAYSLDTIEAGTGTAAVELDVTYTGEAAEGAFPVIAGKRYTSDSKTLAAPYEDRRVGIRFLNCCNVFMSHMAIRGFGTGVRTNGHSKHHYYYNLTLYYHSYCGIAIGVGQEEADYTDDTGYYTTSNQASDHSDDLASSIDGIICRGDYPEFVVVSDCTLLSIGYDTAAEDLVLGFLATNCTVRNSSFVGDSVRGIDGIEMVGASSGHLVEGNRLHGHKKLCKFKSSRGNVYQAMFKASRDSSIRLVHFCDGETGSGIPNDVVRTEFGYEQRWFNYEAYEAGHLTTLPYDSSDQEAFAENGIVLKAVRPRTGTSELTTHICDNVIYQNQFYAGITAYEGTQGVHIYRNQIFQNEAGIEIGQGDNNAWYNNGDRFYYKEKTKDIHIYQNVIYMNLHMGIHVSNTTEEVHCGPDAGSAHTFEVSDVYIENNAIAHNLYPGVVVASDTVGAVDKVYLQHNLLARNGAGTETQRGTADGKPFQVSWSAEILLNPAHCWSDSNCYLGWAYSPPAGGWTSVHGDLVISWGSAYGAVEDARRNWSVWSADGADEGDTIRWSPFEAYSLQATDLSELDLDHYGDFIGFEGTNGADLADNVEDLSTSMASHVEKFNYRQGLGALCRADLLAATLDVALPSGVTYESGKTPGCPILMTASEPHTFCAPVERS